MNWKHLECLQFVGGHIDLVVRGGFVSPGLPASTPVYGRSTISRIEWIGKLPLFFCKNEVYFDHKTETWQKRKGYFATVLDVALWAKENDLMNPIKISEGFYRASSIYGIYTLHIYLAAETPPIKPTMWDRNPVRIHTVS